MVNEEVLLEQDCFLYVPTAPLLADVARTKSQLSQLLTPCQRGCDIGQKRLNGKDLAGATTCPHPSSIDGAKSPPMCTPIAFACQPCGR